MEKTLNISLTTVQLAELIRQQLPKKERLKLIALLQEEQETPTKTQILAGLSQAVEQVKLHKQGKITLQSADDFLQDLKADR